MNVVVIEDVNLNAFTYHKKRFLCLSADDISKLPRFGFHGTLDDSLDYTINDPVEYGSSAIVKTGEIYILWPDNTWAVLEGKSY